MGKLNQILVVGLLCLNSTQAFAQVDESIIADPAVKQEMTDISNALVPWLKGQGGSDENQMAKILMDAEKNPEEFLSRMPAAQRQQILDLSKKLDNKK